MTKEDLRVKECGHNTSKERPLKERPKVEIPESLMLQSEAVLLIGPQLHFCLHFLQKRLRNAA